MVAVEMTQCDSVESGHILLVRLELAQDAGPGLQQDLRIVVANSVAGAMPPTGSQSVRRSQAG